MMMTTQDAPKKSVAEYLGTLVWDGTPRIDRWLVDCASAEDSPYVRSASRMILVAAVRRARQPGCRFDQMPILDGPQGCGKSAALRVLAVEDEWFCDTLPRLDDDSRAIIEATAGKWIVEAGEIQHLLQGDNAEEEDAEAEEPDDESAEGDDEDAEDGDDDSEEDDLPSAAALKVFLSRQVDEARLPYQRERTRVPRQFVVVGTTAATPLLGDTSGQRRFWPIRVGRFDLVRLAEVRDQLWAEAAAAESSGESICLDATAPNA
jgi:predicted P-loop ATPase